MHEYDFQIEYQKGKDNVVENALRKKRILTTITFLKAIILDVVRTTSQEDLFFNKVTSTLPILSKSKKQLRIVVSF